MRNSVGAAGKGSILAAGKSNGINAEVCNRSGSAFPSKEPGYGTPKTL